MAAGAFDTRCCVLVVMSDRCVAAAASARRDVKRGVISAIGGNQEKDNARHETCPLILKQF